MGRLIITPSKDVVYPDRGGYTGFYIGIWDTGYNSPDKYILETPWGSLEGTRSLRKSRYVFEARFFVFGSWLQRFLKVGDSWETLTQESDNLFLKWKPLMDEVITKERLLWEEDGRRGIHIDEVVDDSLRSQLKGG